MTLTGTHTGAQLIWECLTREGVTTVFGYPGGAILPAYDAMVGFDIRHVLVRHEQSAVHMADGYARASGRVGVVVATSGPGATNLVTGLATAMMDSTPLVAITGQVGSGVLGTDAFQEVDITGITLPVTKHNYLVTRAADIVPALREAFAVAKQRPPRPRAGGHHQGRPAGPGGSSTGKRPSLSGTYATCRPRRIRRPWNGPLELIRSAKRPLILAGHGIQLSGARAEVLTLAERADIPFALTLLGLGAVPATHPLSLGMMGMHGEAWVNQAIQEADLLLALGMRFDDRVTGKLKDVRSPREEDPHRHRRQRAGQERSRGRGHRRGSAQHPAGPAARCPGGGPLRLAGDDPGVARRFRRPRHQEPARRRPPLRRPGDARPVAPHRRPGRRGHGRGPAPDVGGPVLPARRGAQPHHQRGRWAPWASRCLRRIGAKIARPEAEVWVVAGDGGFQMTFAELMTAVQEGVKVNIAIINNGYLGMVRQWQAMFYEGRYAATPILSPDFVKLAEAFGIHGQRVDTRAALAEAVAVARAAAGTALIEFRVEQEDSVYPMVPAGAALHEMIRRPDAPAKASAIAETGSDPV